MIVVEGPDGAGKTSLISKLLAEVPRLFLYPRHADSHGPTTNIEKWVTEQLSTNIPPMNAVFDRHALISEPIYGPIIRRKPLGKFADGFWYKAQWDMFIGLRPLVIYCLPPLEVVKDNLDQEREQMEGVKENIDAIYWAYHFSYLYHAKAYHPYFLEWNYYAHAAHIKEDLLLKTVELRMKRYEGN